MELLEVDDIGFYPCTCGYQVRIFPRFFGERIRFKSITMCLDLQILLASAQNGRKWFMSGMSEALFR